MISTHRIAHRLARIPFWVLLVTLATASPAAAARPDIVLIVADDLGGGDLGCFGAADLRTPALDALAAQGLRWRQFYASCSVCSPTRASIHSGRYPDRSGVPGVIRTHKENSWGKLADVPLLPQLLSTAGYQTCCVGKWHLGLEEGDHPLDRGYDQFRGFLGDMMDDYTTHLRHGNNYMRVGREMVDPQGHATQIFTDWACQSIDTLAADPAPYFLYLAYNAPHTPIQPPEAALARVRARDPRMDEKRARLAALIEDMDRGVGVVLDRLRATRRDTVVIFVSDNGGQLDVGAFNGPIRGGKQSMYEGGLRIPAIFAWPGRIQPGGETTAIGSTIDLLPTLCEIVGIDSPPGIDGQSLWPWLQQPAAPQEDRELYFVRREGGLQYAGLTIEALRVGPWKLVHNFPTQPFELYNLNDDPLEQQDLARTHNARLKQMVSRLQWHLQRGGQVPWQSVDR